MYSASSAPPSHLRAARKASRKSPRACDRKTIASYVRDHHLCSSLWRRNSVCFPSTRRACRNEATEEDGASHVVEARTCVASQADGTVLLPIRKTQERHKGWMEGKTDACWRVEVARFREDGMGRSWPMRLWDDTPSTREPGFHSACACAVPAFPEAVHDVPRGPVSRTADRTCERRRRVERRPRRSNAASKAVPVTSSQRVSSLSPPRSVPIVRAEGVYSLGGREREGR